MQSAIGVVHNALLLDNPERTVVYGPFRPLPRSLVNGEFVDLAHATMVRAQQDCGHHGRLLSRLAANPSYRSTGYLRLGLAGLTEAGSATCLLISGS